MAKVKRQRRKIDTWKTKKWYDIIAPPMFGEQEIGETFSSDPSNLVGRTIEVPLSTLTGNFSKQHVILKFQIIEVHEKMAKTRFVGHMITREYMRSLIRRKTTRIEGVSDVVTKDGVKVRIKALALALGRAQVLQEKLIRKILHDVAARHAKKMDLDTFIHDVVIGKIPSAMYREAGKIYPLKRLEVRKTEILSSP
ncbi:MAG: 30S ribosomal protein S3ae [Methanobacteriota archaeon]|nr:MAG: 30S ribosomal protein S3ae [Euryarchaeota archaeon]